MSPQEQQTALQDLRESKRLELLVCEPQDIRRPLRPQKARDCMRVGNLWSMAVYGSLCLWSQQRLLTHFAADFDILHFFDIFACRFRHFRLALAFLLQSFDLTLASLATRWTCVHSVHVVRCLIVCVFDICVFRAWVKEQRKQVYRCLQMFTVYSMAIFWCEWHVRLRIPWLCGIEAPCLISCQQWLSHRFFVEDFP